MYKKHNALKSHNGADRTIERTLVHSDRLDLSVVAAVKISRDRYNIEMRRPPRLQDSFWVGNNAGVRHGPLDREACARLSVKLIVWYCASTML